MRRIFIKNMCQYQVLYHHDVTGYVLRCEDCENIQFCYGNLMVNFTEPDFMAFRTWLRQIRDQQEPSLSETLRCIIIPTPCEGMKLVLSLREIKELDEMLESADTELQTHRLIGLFN